MGEAMLIRKGGTVFRGLTVVSQPETVEYVTGQYVDVTGAVIVANMGNVAIPLHESAWTYSPTRALQTTDTAITFSATIGRITKSVSVPITVAALSPTFNDNSWEQIALAAQMGLANRLWAVGDQKTFTLGANTVSVRIIGFNYDPLDSSDAKYSDPDYNGGLQRAALTLQWTTPAGRNKMNLAATNTGGWLSSNMNTTTLPALFSNLPSELKDAIRTVDKYTCIGGSTSSNRYVSNMAADKLFLLGSYEVYESPAYIGPVEANYGGQYEYYAGISNPHKGSYYEWLRSPHDPDACEGDHFAAILLDGTQRTNNDSINNANVSNDYYPAFCI